MVLESHWVNMPRQDFDEITSICVPGANDNNAKAELMRSFVIPERLMAPNSSSNTSQRTCNIPVAFISDHNVWALLDFSRLVQFRLRSSDRLWII